MGSMNTSDEQEEGSSGRREGMEIVFYDVETTVPEAKGQGFEILEFGAVVVSARGLEEIDSFTTLIRPSSLAAVSPRTTACNGIVKDSLLTAPTFVQIAPKIHALLHGRVWAGHNILRFDNVRIKEAFASAGIPGPEAAGFIDTLPLLRKTFGQRAGNLKMNTLASYFGLGKQEHRSLADVRMNLEILKLCATVVFLESNFPEIYPVGMPSPVTRSSTRGDAFNLSLLAVSLEEAAQQDANLNKAPEVRRLTEEVPKKQARTVLEEPKEEDPQPVTSATNGEECSPAKQVTVASREESEYLKPTEVSLECLRVVPEGHWLTLMHGSKQLCIKESNARVKYSVSDRFAYSLSGKPTFTIVIVPSPELLTIVKECEMLVKRNCSSMGVDATWQPVLVPNGGDFALRIKIGTSGEGSNASYTTKFYKGTNNSIEEVCIESVDPKTFQQAVGVGCTVDVTLRCDGYAFHGGKVGLRFLAEELLIHHQ